VSDIGSFRSTAGELPSEKYRKESVSPTVNHQPSIKEPPPIAAPIPADHKVEVCRSRHLGVLKVLVERFLLAF
jgi:hypothetical protein